MEENDVWRARLPDVGVADSLRRGDELLERGKLSSTVLLKASALRSKCDGKSLCTGKRNVSRSGEARGIAPGGASMDAVVNRTSSVCLQPCGEVEAEKECR